MERLIFENDIVQVIHRPGPELETLVTFSWAGFAADGKNYWAKPVAEKLDLNCIGFVSKQPNWFPPKFMMDAVAAARPFLLGRVILYGSSMGAFAALKFNSILRADLSIALSPQCSIDPAIVPRTRYTKFFVQKWHQNLKIEPGDIAARSYVVFDPHYADDREHFENMRDIPHIIPIHANFVNHDTVFIVGRTSSVSELFALAVRDDRRGLFRLFHDRKRLEPWSLRSLAVVCQERGKFGVADQLLKKAEALGLSRHVLLPLKFSLAQAVDDWDAATGSAIEAISLEATKREDLTEFAEFLFLRERWRESVAAFRRLIEAGAKSESNFRRLAQAARNAGHHGYAIEILTEAVGLWPTKNDLRVSLAWAQLANSNFAESIEGFRRQIARDPTVVSYYIGLMDSLRRSLHGSEALAVAKSALVLFPGEVKLQRWLDIISRES